MTIVTRQCFILVGLVISSGAVIAVPDKGALVPLEIHNQSLDQALNEWAQQTGYSLLVPFNAAIEGKLAPQVTGMYTADGALQILLANNSLQYEYVNSKTVAIRSARAPSNRVETGSSDSSGADTRSADRLRLSGVDRRQVADDAVEESERKESVSGAQKGLPEVLIRGSKSLNTDIKRSKDAAQPYVVFERKAIEQSGATNLEEFFKKQLSADVSSVNNSQVGIGSSSGNTSSINLRGLGADETLILVDGRRKVSLQVSSDAPHQPDLNGIPLSAIERIEVLPTTASGIYGGGATGGVVNIVLRRDYSGIEMNLAYGNTFDSAARSRRVDVSGGFNLEGGRTNILMTGSWADSDPLVAGDRDFVIRARQHVLQTNPSGIYSPFLPPTGTATNIGSANGSPLTLRGSNRALGSSITSVPSGYAGPASDGGLGLLTGAGTYNLELPDSAQITNATGLLQPGKRYALVNAPTVKSLTLAVRRKFVDWLDAFVDLGASENSGFHQGSSNIGILTIAAGAAGNPFNQQIRVTTPDLGQDQAYRSLIKSKRAAAGVIIELPKEWSLGLDYVWERATTTVDTPGIIDTSAVSAAVSAGTLNVFRDTSAFPVDLSTFTLAPNSTPPIDSTLQDVTTRVSGRLPFSLPGGPPTLSMLLEHRSEVYGDQLAVVPITRTLTQRIYNPEKAQKVQSAYLELLMPFVSDRNAVRWIHQAELQLAGRYDHYRTDAANRITSVDPAPLPFTSITEELSTLSSIDPTVAFRYQPIQDITFRTSYGTGFLPPNVTQLVPSLPTPPRAPVFPLRDPLRGNELVGVINVRSGGNPDLSPEQSKSWSAGVIFTPRFIDGLRISADWTSIRKTDNIASIDVLHNQSALNDLITYFPGRVTRSAPSGGFAVGAITALDASLINIATLKVDAIDFAVNQSVSSDRGIFDLELRATNLRSLESQLSPSAPAVDAAGVGIPATLSGNAGLKWRINGSVTWAHGGWTVGWAARYFSSYYFDASHTFNANQGSATVASQIYHDLFGGYRFHDSTGVSAFGGMEIQFGVSNVFNKEPPIDVVGYGLNSPGYSYYGDPRLANYYLAVKKSFSRH